jgi:uncharacterized Tic20 family protein
LIAFLAKGKDSPTIKAHATAALNFFIPVSAVSIVALIARVCVGVLDLGAFGTLVQILLWLVVVATWVVGVLFGVLAGIKANEGTLYKYPLNFTIIK